jgi:electron transport complex protein RnfG
MAKLRKRREERRLRNTLGLVWKLLLICFVAGLVLGLVNEVTKGPIEEQEKAAADNARAAAFPGAKSFEQLKHTLLDEREFVYYNALGENNELLGVVGSSRAKGYGGDIEVVVGMNLKGEVVGTVIGGNGDFSETAGLGAKVKDEAFAKQFIGLQYGGDEVKYSEGGGGYVIPAGSIIVQKADSGSEGGIDAISGATYSSKAVIEAFNNTCTELYKLIGK